MVAGGILNLEFDAVAAGKLAEILLGIVQKFGGSDRLDLEPSLAGFHPGPREKIFGEARHAGGILSDDFEELASGRAVLGSGVEQGFRISLDGSEGRTKFVGNVGDEIAAGFLDPLGFSEIAEHGDGASAGERGGGYVGGAAG